MTAAQRDYLLSRGIDPWSLEWGDAQEFDVNEWGVTEAARLPDGRVLLANGRVANSHSQTEVSA